MPLIGSVSGSHTRLTDGKSIIAGGSNVTVTSASNGQITIASSGGSTSPAGSNTQVQFNNAGSFGADSDLFFIAASNTLSVPNLAASAVGPPSGFNSVVVSSGTESVSPGTDTLLFVSGNFAGTHSSVFGGTVKVSSSLSVGSEHATLPTSTALEVYANANGSYVTTITNDQSNNGHVLSLASDGTGNGTNLLNIENGSDTVFRARGDGRFGFGPSGVSSMGAGTFVVGIDGSHSADIAISKRLQHLGDSNTYMDFPQADSIQFVAGGEDTLLMYTAGGSSQVLILSGGAATSPDPTDANDVAFFVSGALESKNSNVKGTAVFGGDLVVSGVLHGGVDPESQDGATTLEINADAIIVSSLTGAETVELGSDVCLFVSGAATPMMGAFVSPARVATFGGDLMVSGVIRGAYSPMGGVNIARLGGVGSVVQVETGVIPMGAVGFDTSFFVSGAIGSKNFNGGATSVFGGDVNVSGSLYNTGMESGSGANVMITMAGAFVYDASDRNLKDDIQPLENSLERIKQCEGVSFRFKNDPAAQHVGVIAQDMQPVIPEVVTRNPDGYLSVDYSKITAVLIEAVKEQQTVIEDLKTRIERLEN
jgi:hypothetical protein